MHYLLSFQILLDRNGRTRASKLLWGSYIIRCLSFFVWGEFLSVSWILLKHHGSFVVADWCRDFKYGGAMRMHTD